MSSFFRANPGVSQAKLTPSITHLVAVPQIERWRICYRLQELMIPCSCPEDGSLQVEVQNSIVALLLWSVVRQFLSPRQEMVQWLERCWEID